MIQARLRIRTGNQRLSRSIIRSVEPDNLGMKGLVVNGTANREWAKFVVKYGGKIETFISTMDDMLTCVQAATRTLKVVGRKLE